MVQFYFLSIVANLIGGLALSSGYLDQRFSGMSGVKEFFESRPGIRVTIGVVSVIVGVLKLLSVTTGDVPVVGDLIPALTGLIVGVALLFERYKEKSTIPSETQGAALNAVDRIVLKNKTLLGSIAMIVGVLHFLLPRVLFL